MARNLKKRVKRTEKKATKKAAKLPVSEKLFDNVILDKQAVAAEKTSLDTLYIVNSSNNPVTLQVIAGAEGQTSDMTIKLDDTAIAENLAGDFKETALGSNKELNGKKLSIVATIADTSGTTNLTSLTIQLKGGIATGEFPLSKTVDEDGESEDYLCLIEFFNPLS